MNLKEYLSGINNTWKTDTRTNELAHCEMALVEEIGEIAGWYKKHLFFGVPKEKLIINLKGEFGDLLYYIVKYSELLNNTNYLNSTLNRNKLTKDVNVTKELSKMTHSLSTILKAGEGFSMTNIALNDVADSLTMLILNEGWTVEEIMKSNLAKLKVRYGELFNPIQADPNQRNLKLEDKAL